MMSFTSEMVEKAKVASSIEELLALAAENKVELTEEEASAYFAQLNPQEGELSDDELDNVSGGGCEASQTAPTPAVQPRLTIGQIVYLSKSGHTSGSTCCLNRVCCSEVFRIAKQIEAEKYLLECMKCDWTYHAVKDNIEPV